MKLGDGPALLVLSGQGIGNGVGHFAVPISAGSDYPPMDLLEEWCSPSDPLIPTLSQDLVLMIARQATSDGTPWAILALYVQADLKRTRKKHYAGVGLVAKEAIIPTEAFPVVHKILEAMIGERMEDRKFFASLAKWSPHERLLGELNDLTVEYLQPGFKGIQPGQERARVFHGVPPNDIVKAAQEGRDYDGFCAAFLLNRDEPPAKSHEYMASRFDVAAWERARSLPAPPPSPGLGNAAFPSNRSFSDGGFVYDGASSRRDRDHGPPSLTMVAGDLEVLEGTVAGLRRSVRSLGQTVSELERRRKSLDVRDWAFLIAAAFVAILAAGLFWKYVLNDRSVIHHVPMQGPENVSSSDLNETRPSPTANGTTLGEAGGVEGSINDSSIANATLDASSGTAAYPDTAADIGSRAGGEGAQAQDSRRSRRADR